MAREKLSLTEDEPLIIKLDFGPEGVEYPSKFGKGTEYMYTVNDDENIIYLKPEARDAVVQSGAQAGDEISISKQRVGRNTRYVVELMGDAKEPPPPAPTRRPVAAAQSAGRPGLQAVARTATARVLAAAPATAAPSQHVYPLMDRCMRAACALVKESIVDHAAAIGLPLNAVAVEDIRTVGITLFIKETNGR